VDSAEPDAAPLACGCTRRDLQRRIANKDF
jgi:hypothetical protein